ncbi:MAG: hypothetical protein KJ755_06750 [Alphaproteobacteria bacterium]|jgi:hypothetical protein|uniref:DUF2188 domain-containing protein n=1 Tax=Peteryoungia algae TaxID=2919917 RepID=A0ABT0CVV8_9HYPH|nr:hypothetical protein [Rhizobium sp. SSM4.3]MBU2327044.1 hypothetical protein [Alphaproteobacteria bacterium]MCJ8237297.1 hypothetical protein [Rhizobium sp. SSM4.3]
MTLVYCDIVPQANGWCFLSEEGQSAVYPSYRLAVEAARQHLESQRAQRKLTVIRQQDLRGHMLEVAGIAQAWSPEGTAGTDGRA